MVCSLKVKSHNNGSKYPRMFVPTISCERLDLELSKPSLVEIKDDVPSNLVWLQKDRQFSRRSKLSYFVFTTTHCDFDLTDGNSSSLSDSGS